MGAVSLFPFLCRLEIFLNKKEWVTMTKAQPPYVTAMSREERIPFGRVCVRTHTCTHVCAQTRISSSHYFCLCGIQWFERFTAGMGYSPKGNNH